MWLCDFFRVKCLVWFRDQTDSMIDQFMTTLMFINHYRFDVLSSYIEAKNHCVVPLLLFVGISPYALIISANEPSSRDAAGKNGGMEKSVKL